jgi:hypothetical protein
MQSRPIDPKIAHFVKSLTGQSEVLEYFCPRCSKTPRIEPLDMTETYRARAKLYGVKFKALPEMDFGRENDSS